MISSTAQLAAACRPPASSVGCDCPALHVGGPRCGARAVYLYRGDRVATEAVRWYAEIELGWVRDNRSGLLVCEACGPACDGGAAALRQAVLTASDLARWPDGGRVVDASASVLEDLFLPVLLRELVSVTTSAAAPRVSDLVDKADLDQADQRELERADLDRADLDRADGRAAR